MPPKRKSALESVEPQGPGSEHAGSKRRRTREHALTGRALRIHRARTANRTARTKALARLRSTPNYQQMDAHQRAVAEEATSGGLMDQRWNEGVSGDYLEHILPADDDDDDNDSAKDPVLLGLAVGTATPAGGSVAAAPVAGTTASDNEAFTEGETIGRAVERRMRPVIEFWEVYVALGGREQLENLDFENPDATMAQLLTDMSEDARALLQLELSQSLGHGGRRVTEQEEKGENDKEDEEEDDVVVFWAWAERSDEEKEDDKEDDWETYCAAAENIAAGEEEEAEEEAEEGERKKE